MALESIIRKTWNQNILFSALVELTYKCNLNCFYCYNDLALSGHALRDEQWLRFFDDLALMQVMNLTLSGGEPLSHPSFLELGRHARQLGFVVRIKSNGHALRGRLARQVKDEIDPFVIEISLHGATAEAHDRQTRIPGSFDRLVANLGELRDLGLRIKLNCTLTVWNESEIDGIFALTDRLGLPMAIHPTVTPRDDGDTTPLQIAPTSEGIQRLYAALDRRIPDSETRADSEGPDGCTPTSGVETNCGAGTAGIAVDPYGNVYPCVQWRRSIGNLHEQSIRDIWEGGSSDLEEVREINRAARRMRDEREAMGDPLGHCMGLAVEKTGDPLGLDPEARRHVDLRADLDASKPAKRRSLLPVVS
ncbi:MAG: radical SAM protein [Acidobacteriota bacterium]